MLVLSNGAFKSGSTWLFNILTMLKSFDWPDERYLTKGNAKHPAIAEPMLKTYLNTGDFASRDVISKNHLGKPEHRDLLLGNDSVRVICMTRDSRDVIVSAYYHHLRKTRTERSFSQFYWEFGRELLPDLTQYAQTWAEPHPHLTTTTFESLKADFGTEVRRIAGLLGLQLEAAQIDKLKGQTDISSLREKYEDAPSHRSGDIDFFRKGEIGDWQNHFDDKILKDHDRICREGLSALDTHILIRRAKRKVRRMFS